MTIVEYVNKASLPLHYRQYKYQQNWKCYISQVNHFALHRVDQRDKHFATRDDGVNQSHDVRTWS